MSAHRVLLIALLLVTCPVAWGFSLWFVPFDETGSLAGLSLSWNGLLYSAVGLIGVGALLLQFSIMPGVLRLFWPRITYCALCWIQMTTVFCMLCMHTHFTGLPFETSLVSFALGTLIASNLYTALSMTLVLVLTDVFDVAPPDTFSKNEAGHAGC